MNSDNNNNGTPRLRFPGFTGEWEEKLVKEICDINTGKSNTQDQVEDGLYPFYIRSATPVRSNRYLYDCEAVITIGDGHIGKVFHYVNGKFDLHQRCYMMSNFNGVDARYFYYYFSANFYERAMRLTAKATVDSVRLEMIADMPIYLPSITEQQKIADCLSTIDTLIAAQEQMVAALKERKRGLMQQLFPQPGESTPRLRFPDFTGEWEKKKFKECFDIGNGRDYKHLSEGDIPVYGSGGYMCSVNDYLYDGDSACIGRKGTINKPMFLRGKFWTVDTLFYTYNFVDTSAYFVYLLFQNIDWMKHNEAGGVPSLSRNIIYNISVLLPEPAEQQKIVNCISAMDDLIATEAAKLDTLKIHKKGLTQQLFPQPTK